MAFVDERRKPFIKSAGYLHLFMGTSCTPSVSSHSTSNLSKKFHLEFNILELVIAGFL